MGRGYAAGSAGAFLGSRSVEATGRSLRGGGNEDLRTTGRLRKWLGDQDSNLGSQIQSLTSCH